MAIVIINGVGLPAPTSLSVGKQDLDSPDSTRNERGYLQRDRIRAGVYRLELQFNLKKASEIRLIENTLVNSKLTVTFPDAGGNVTKEMYVGDRTKELVLNHTNPSLARWSLGFNLVEY